MINFNAFDMAKQKMEQQGGGGGFGPAVSWFSLADGESKTIRFLMHGLREDLVIAEMHRFVSVMGQNGMTHRNFVCMSSVMNAQCGLIPNDNGAPIHQCPIDNAAFNRTQKGAPRRPTMRGFGLAVEREVVRTEMQTLPNGYQMSVPVEVRDVLVVDEDGKQHPKVVMVDMSFQGFWAKVDAAMQGVAAQALCDVDWQVSRMGSGTNTTYDVQVLPSAPAPIDVNSYSEWMVDVHEYVSRLGQPQYYVNYGFNVPGYVPPADSANAQQPQVVQQQPMPQYAQQPVRPATGYQAQVGIPASVSAGAVKWDNVPGNGTVGFMGR